MAKKVDILILDPKGKVDKDRCTLKKGDHEEAQWVSQGDKFTIVFQESPFAKPEFTVPAGGSVSSGEAVAPVEKPPKEYKYTVVGPGGSNDPIIVIDR